MPEAKRRSRVYMLADTLVLPSCVALIAAALAIMIPFLLSSFGMSASAFFVSSVLFELSMIATVILSVWYIIDRNNRVIRGLDAFGVDEDFRFRESDATEEQRRLNAMFDRIEQAESRDGMQRSEDLVASTRLMCKSMLDGSCKMSKRSIATMYELLCDAQDAISQSGARAVKPGEQVLQCYPIASLYKVSGVYSATLPDLSVEVDFPYDADLIIAIADRKAVEKAMRSVLSEALTSPINTQEVEMKLGVTIDSDREDLFEAHVIIAYNGEDMSEETIEAARQRLVKSTEWISSEKGLRVSSQKATEHGLLTVISIELVAPSAQ